MIKYVKSTTNYQMVIKLQDNAGPDKSYPIPPMGTIKLELSDSEINYIKNKYNGKVIIL